MVSREEEGEGIVKEIRVEVERERGKTLQPE